MSASDFPEEARKIHYEEAEARAIYGETSREEAAALSEEGIDVHPLPKLPEEPTDKPSGRRLDRHQHIIDGAVGRAAPVIGERVVDHAL